MTAERILEILKDLHGKSGKIKACMVARKGLEGVVMFPESFKKDAGPVWEPLSKTLDDILQMIGKYAAYGIDKICLEAFGFLIVFYVIEMSDTALMVFLRQEEDSMKKLLELSSEIDKARKKIIE